MMTTSDGWDTRIPYRLGTDHYCEFEDDGGFVHMDDLVAVFEYVNDCDDNTCGNIYSGRLCGVKYDYNGFISEVTLFNIYDDTDFDIESDGVFYYASEVEEHDD